MSLEPPSYLATLQNNVRQRPIPWDGAVRAGVVTDAQLAKIRAIDRAKNKESKKSAIEKDVDSYTELFVGETGKPSALESAAKQPNMLQYLLVLLDDLVNCKFNFQIYGVLAQHFIKHVANDCFIILRRPTARKLYPRGRKSLSQLPALLKPLEEPRRPDTTSNIASLDKYNVQSTRYIPSYRKSPPRITQVPIGARGGQRHYQARHCHPTILQPPVRQSITEAVLEDAGKDHRAYD
jgi:hypothetical protein